MNYEDYQARILKCRENFAKHEITIICDHERVKRFQFRRKDTGCYGFNLTTADNLIVMNGDCYSLLVEPGYGRDGFWFLINNICRDWSYLLSKCPTKQIIEEYSYSAVKDNLKYYVENEYITQEQVDEARDLDEGDFWGKMAYWEFCREHEIDDPLSPMALTGTTLNQVAGLQMFAEKYKEQFIKDDTTIGAV